MALLADIDDSYTKTGKGLLTQWANKLSFFPPILKIPFIGTSLTALLGYTDTVIESAQWLLRGKLGSAVTVAASGFVGTSVNAFTDTWTWWGGNAISGALTGTSIGTHARAATEALVGGISGVLGSKPQVLRSYPAAIGSINAGVMPQGPGKFMTEAARSRGEDPDAAYARMQAGQADHLAALDAARAQGTGAYRGV